MAFRTNKMPVLQEKSASGAVASFNTALTMPLASCNIAVNAWQEGSGDPSPVNNRPIHGFSEVNAKRAGKNLYNDERTFANPSTIQSGNVKRLFTPNTYCLGMSSNNYMAGTLPPPSISNVIVGNGSISYDVSSIQGGTAYTTLCCPVYNLKVGETYFVSGTRTQCDIYVTFYKKDGTYINYTNQPNRPFIVPKDTDFAVIIFRAGNVGTVKVENIQLELGSTATPYEPYVTPTIYTIQLGQEVYGAEVDVVNGVAHCTWNKKTVGELSFTAQSGNRFTATISDCVNTPNFTGFLCSTYKPILVNANNNTWLSNRVITIVDNRYTTATEFKEAMGDTQIVYPIAEPFDIQLTPQQIETVIGNNTIFADTGDVDLTFKDLDIAKRGNFREVFKLPS